MDVSMYVCMHLSCMYVYMYVCMYVCMYILYWKVWIRCLHNIITLLHISYDYKSAKSMFAISAPLKTQPGFEMLGETLSGMRPGKRTVTYLDVGWGGVNLNIQQ